MDNTPLTDEEYAEMQENQRKLREAQAANPEAFGQALKDFAAQWRQQGS